MKIAILTSSRADYGIYLPLLKKLKINPCFDLILIAFGTHLSPQHGNTIDQILEDGFEVDYRIETIPSDDTPLAISVSVGETIRKFGIFWNLHRAEFDIVFCLGDRYEMFAAVTAGIPFQIAFAHLHGGETTLGAIDNIFRQTITLASTYHFASNTKSVQRIMELTESDKNIFNVGALSLDNLEEQNILSVEIFREKWGIDLSKKTILTTFHPETVAVSKNSCFVEEIIDSLNALESYQILVTMPNADTSGSIIRKRFIEEFQNSARVLLVENLGSKSYFTALKFCVFLLGNTSSGIIEAASFGKYVINLGDRQKGRICGPNVIQVPIKKRKILNAVTMIENASKLTTANIYYNGGASQKIINILTSIS